MASDLAKLLQKQKNHILELWMNKQLADAGLREDLLSNEDLREQSQEFLDAVIKYVGNNKEGVAPDEFDDVFEVLSGISMSRAKQGFSPRETGIYIFGLKDALMEVIQKEYSKDLETLLKEFNYINKLVDSFGIVTFETFIKGREEVIIRQTDEITEISTPVIRVWDGILALPIIGTLDSSRTQVVMENLLQEIVVTGSSIAILDISGVPTVDSLVAQHLIKTVSATRLMGAECIISGIRPEIAQTVVHLGIDLSNIITKASLASALRYAFSMLQLEVKKSSQNRS